MKNITIVPLKHPIQKEITLPGSLSFTVRALILAAQMPKRVKIINAAKCDDAFTVINLLRKLGIGVSEERNCFTVDGDIGMLKNKLHKLNVGISGRTARMAMALLSLVPGVKIVSCGEEFKKRPIGDLVNGLRQLGAKIEFLEKNGFLPVKISSSRLNPGLVKLKASLSSQFLSAILLVAPTVGEIKVELSDTLTSRPFVDMTIDIMKDFGIEVKNKNYKTFTVPSGQCLRRDTYIVETDATAASYFWAVAAVAGSKIRIKNISPLSKQGDIYFADILEKMGCHVRKNKFGKWIEVAGMNRLQGIDVDLNSCPDIAQTLVVVSAFSAGKTIIRGINNLKFKETDRIVASKKELEKMGIKVIATKDSLEIFGGRPHKTEIDTHGDHRMAMSFAVAGAKIEGIKIMNSDVVNKSFPDFWQKLQSLGIDTR